MKRLTEQQKDKVGSSQCRLIPGHAAIALFAWLQ